MGTRGKGANVENMPLGNRSRRKDILQPFRIFYSLLHHHLVAAGAAIDEAMQQGFARPGDATGFLAIIFGVVVMQHGLNLFESRPTDVRGILIVDPNAPLLHGEPLGGWPSWRGAVPYRARPAIGERPRIRWVLQDGEDRGDGRAFPDHLSEAIAPRQAQALGLQHFEHLAG